MVHGTPWLHWSHQDSFELIWPASVPIHARVEDMTGWTGTWAMVRSTRSTRLLLCPFQQASEEGREWLVLLLQRDLVDRVFAVTAILRSRLVSNRKHEYPGAAGGHPAGCGHHLECHVVAVGFLCRFKLVRRRLILDGGVGAKQLILSLGQCLT